MANAVKWTVPFVSLNGTQYKIDIYEKGYTGRPIQLMGGAEVFTTDEENSDDFFSPVRTQTGTLRLIDTDGTLLEQLLPENNTHRFVRLTDVSANAVRWQGFLSCEVYSQTYTARTQELNITVNSILAAMESKLLDNGVAAQFKTVRAAIADALKSIEEEAGVTLFDKIVFPRSGVSILTKYFNMSTFFDKKEQCNEDMTTYTIAGISTKEMLERVCQFMGWTLRECGQNIHFCAPDDRLGMLRVSFQVFKNLDISLLFEQKSYTQKQMGQLNWTGDGHSKSISQGAKSVEVVANLSDFTLDIDLPDCPVGNLEEFYKTVNVMSTTPGSLYWYMLANTNASAYSNMEFGVYKATLNGFYGQFADTMETSIADLFSRMCASATPMVQYSYQMPNDSVTFRFGSFLCKTAIETEWHSAHNTSGGLHCVMIPGKPTEGRNANLSTIVKIKSVLYNTMSNGFLNINADAEFAQLFHSGMLTVGDLISDTQAKIWLTLRFGEKYWNGESWVSDESKFPVEFEKRNFKSNWESEMEITEKSGYLVPVTDILSGEIELSIWPMLNQYDSAGKRDTPVEITFHSLSVEGVFPTNSKRQERKENHYFRLLGVNFSDEKFIDFQLGSDLNNLPSPSTPMEDIETPITKIAFVDRSGNEVIERPELNLLDRACRYYKKARRMVELVVEHPSGEDLAAHRLHGFDGHDYAPLSESRNWAEDSSTIRCFEMPDASED